eukprot:8744955-Alexandrium_andersonii.AAC.1
MKAGTFTSANRAPPESRPMIPFLAHRQGLQLAKSGGERAACRLTANDVLAPRPHQTRHERDAAT